MKSFSSEPPSTTTISMPAIIVPFERLSPKYYKFSIYTVLMQISKATMRFFRVFAPPFLYQFRRAHISSFSF